MGETAFFVLLMTYALIFLLLCLIQKIASTFGGSRQIVYDSSSLETEEAEKDEKDHYEYEVFLSFRGKDTRNKFTSHLDERLRRYEIHVFKDDRDLRKGEKIDELLGYIEKSEIFVPILSEHYAESTWCLREIEQMVKCGRTIIPIFYEVKPSDVREQKGHYAEAFRCWFRLNAQKKRWKDALRTVGGLTGQELKQGGDEAKCITKVVERILQSLRRQIFRMPDHPVGIDNRVKAVLKLLDVGCDDKRMVVIHGINGIGKTALAKNIFNKISRKFEVPCFLSDVREVLAADKSHDGLFSLQKAILSKALPGKAHLITEKGDGSLTIQRFLRLKSTLLVVDDVDDIKHLEDLAGEEGWFGSKSRVIVTTTSGEIPSLVSRRNKWPNTMVYQAQRLSKDESLKLFHFHVFDTEEPPDQKFMWLCKEVVETTHGIPLVIQEFGPLFWEKGEDEWKGILKELQENQHKTIHERLRVCYDVLSIEAKRVFLDIACFFIGENKDEAFDIWGECTGFQPYQSLETLTRRSLVKINGHNKFEMHGLIRDMGREIVAKEAGIQTFKRTRLWTDRDILEVVNRPKEFRKALRGISLQSGWERTWQDMGTLKGFESLNQLQLLHLFLPQSTMNLFLPPKKTSGARVSLPTSLKSLQLDPCPFEFKSFTNLTSLVVLKLNEGPFRVLTLEKKYLKLKVLDLSRCKELISTPDFAYLPTLRKLILQRCCSLSDVHESIQNLTGLNELNMGLCTSLAESARSIFGLSSLRSLNLSRCWKSFRKTSDA